LSVDNTSDADSTEYIFEIIPGFANETSTAEIKLTEVTSFSSNYSFDVLSESKSNLTLYPSLPKKLEINFEIPNEYIPNNSQLFGKITFENSSTKKVEYELPINFKF
jgi:hypothetical protein